MARQPKVTSLKPGDPIPEGEPRRYPNSRGYIRLRWKVAPYTYVEAYEHRVIVGAQAGQDVHHRDHSKANNSPANLEILSKSEHTRRHSSRIDVQRAMELYAKGLSTVEVGKLLGHDPSAVWRALKRNGITPRSISTSQRMHLDTELVLRLARSGMRVKAIAKQLGVSPTPVQRVLKEAGFPPFPQGRPRKT